MVRHRRPLVVLAALLALALAPGAQGAERPGQRPGAPAAVPGQIIVTFEPGVPAARRAATRERAGVRARRALSVPGAQLVATEPGTTTGQAIRRLAAEPHVRSATPNRTVRARATTPDDPLYGRLWGLPAIKAPEAWDLETGDASVVVAVVDEGVRYDHPDLAPRMWRNPADPADGADNDGNGLVDDVHGADTVDKDADPMDIGGHGTHVAGTIAARGNDAFGMTGVAWDARIMALRALGPDGGTDATVAEAFQYAVSHGADIVNASLGRAGALDPLHSQIIADHPEVLFVFAAGNDDQDVDQVGSAPCADPAPNVICVAASGPDDRLAGYSNVGASTVDLAAPGTEILSAAIESTTFSEDFEDGDLAGWSATGAWSFAADDSSAFAVGSGSASLTRTIALGGASCRLTYWWYLTGGSASAVVGGTTHTLDAGGWWYDTVAVTGDLALSFSHSGTGALYLDDISVACPDPSGFALSSGTSMATPHVAGAAALLYAHRPGIDGAQAATTILATVDPIASHTGATVTGGRLNAFAALAHGAPLTTTTGAAHDLTATTATIAGVLGGAATTAAHHFEYGPTPAYGASTPATPVRSPSEVAVSRTLTGLEPGRTYHYRLVAARDGDVVHGADRTFTTAAAPPITAPPAPPADEHPISPVAPVLEDPRTTMRRTARASCRRVRGRLRCRFAAAGARAVRATVRDRRRRVVARLSGRAGRTLRARGRAPRAGSYRVTMGFRDAAGRRATVTRRVRLR